MQVVVLARYWGYTLSRPVGIFQQVNVLASFLSTGLVCLFVSEFQARRVNPGARVIPALRVFALLFIPFMLEQFDDWAAHFQLLHKDPNVMASRLTIAQALTPEKFSTLCAYAHQEWQHEPRFKCGVAAGDSK